MKKHFAIFLFLNILFFGLVSVSLAEDPHVVQLPNSIDEAKTMGEGILPTLPGITKSVWGDGATTLKNIFLFVKSSWIKYIHPEVNKYITPTIQKERPELKENFNKETKEMGQSIKTDMPKVIQSIWDVIKGMGK